MRELNSQQIGVPGIRLSNIVADDKDDRPKTELLEYWQRMLVNGRITVIKSDDQRIGRNILIQDILESDGLKTLVFEVVHLLPESIRGKGIQADFQPGNYFMIRKNRNIIENLRH